MYLSVIIPCYNEEKTIVKTIFSIDHFLSQQKYASEIVVIDDGSKDGTVLRANSAKEMVKNLRVIANAKNHGKGFVIRQAMLEAKGDWRLFTDADNATPVEQVDKLFPYAQKGVDIVIGSRDAENAKVAVHQPFYKELLGNIGNLLIQVVAVWGIKDTQCGFKLFSAQAAQAIFPLMKIDRWGFDIEALALARRLGFAIKEVGITWYNNPNSRVGWKGYLRTLKDLAVIKYNLVLGKYGRLSLRAKV